MSKLKSLTVRINVVDVLIFVNIYVKRNYNDYYKLMFFKKESEVYLRLYKDYNILVNAFITIKLGQ